jgi:hypothetical protein
MKYLSRFGRFLEVIQIADLLHIRHSDTPSPLANPNAELH